MCTRSANLFAGRKILRLAVLDFMSITGFGVLWHVKAVDRNCFPVKSIVLMNLDIDDEYDFGGLIKPCVLHSSGRSKQEKHSFIAR